MRKLINVLFVAAGLLLTTNVANAQQKIAHINSAEIYANFTDAKTATASLEAMAKTKQDDIDKMIKEYQAKMAAAQKKATEVSEANKEVLGKELQEADKELQTLRTRIEDAQKKAQTELQAKEVELFTPVNQKVAAAMNAVAKEKGLAYVFDIASQQGANNLVFFEGGDDITGAVKTKLGISATATPAKAATTPVKKN